MENNSNYNFALLILFSICGCKDNKPTVMFLTKYSLNLYVFCIRPFYFNNKTYLLLRPGDLNVPWTFAVLRRISIGSKHLNQVLTVTMVEPILSKICTFLMSCEIVSCSFGILALPNPKWLLMLIYFLIRINTFSLLNIIVLHIQVDIKILSISWLLFPKVLTD